MHCRGKVLLWDVHLHALDNSASCCHQGNGSQACGGAARCCARSLVVSVVQEGHQNISMAQHTGTAVTLQPFVSESSHRPEKVRLIDHPFGILNHRLHCGPVLPGLEWVGPLAHWPTVAEVAVPDVDHIMRHTPLSFHHLLGDHPVRDVICNPRRSESKLQANHINHFFSQRFRKQLEQPSHITSDLDWWESGNSWCLNVPETPPSRPP